MRDEIIKLKLAAVDKHGEWGEHTPFPFGKHKGEPIGEVPESYLRWWYENNSDRGAIIIEMDFGPWSQRIAAVKKLRLYDYCKSKFNGTSLQQEGQPASQEGW